MIFEESRRKVIATCLTLADKGYLAGTGGNVAYRIDEQHFAMTPSATDYYSMGPEDICVLRLKDLVLVSGDRRPSVEHRLHANVLRARPDCRASIHTHQPIASAYTLLGRSLEIGDPESRAILGPRAVLVGYAPSGTNWLASKLAKALRPEVNAYLMRNHGVVCCGLSLADTIARVGMLEAVCTTYFRSAINSRKGSDEKSPLTEVLTLFAKSGEMESAS